MLTIRSQISQTTEMKGRTKRIIITLVNTQNVPVNKIVDSSSVQCAESKYGLRIQFLALVVMIYEVWLNAENSYLGRDTFVSTALPYG